MTRRGNVRDQSGRATLMLVLMLAQMACASGWRTMRPVTPEPLPPDRVVRIWAGDSVQEWHRVAIREDSVTGIPASRALSCETCHVALARADVDSIQTDTAGAGTAGTAIVIGIGLIVGAFVVCVMQGGCNLRPYD